jgi:hypothetical protein
MFTGDTQTSEIMTFIRPESEEEEEEEGNDEQKDAEGENARKTPPPPVCVCVCLFVTSVQNIDIVYPRGKKEYLHVHLSFMQLF